MRILYVSENYTTHDHRFLRVMTDGGHEAFFFRLRPDPNPKEQRPLPAGVTAVDGSRHSHPVMGIRRAVNALRPHLVHAGPLFNAACYAALGGGRPLVGMSWGYDILLEAERSRLKKLATGYALRRCAAVIADCRVVKERVRGYGVDPARIEVFPWGVDLSHFQPRHSGGVRASLGWDDRFIVLSNRHWEPMYGVDLVVRAFLEVAKREPDPVLLLLGSGSQAPDIRRLVDASGLQQRVHFAGHVPYDVMPDYYGAADLYVSASHCDGSSISLLEAMACARPVLVSDIPGNREWVRDGCQGWCFKDGDVTELVDRLRQAVARRGELDAMGRAARRRAETHADWTRGARRLMDLYDRVAGAH